MFSAQSTTKSLIFPLFIFYFLKDSKQEKEKHTTLCNFPMQQHAMVYKAVSFCYVPSPQKKMLLDTLNAVLQFEYSKHREDLSSSLRKSIVLFNEIKATHINHSFSFSWSF